MAKPRETSRESPTLEHQDLATVYRYRYWDDESAQFAISKWEATLECIRCGLGTPIIHSGRQVLVTELDAFGRLIEPAHRKGGLEH